MTNIFRDRSSGFQECLTCVSRDAGGMSRMMSKRPGLWCASSLGMTGLNGAELSRLTVLTPSAQGITERIKIRHYRSAGWSLSSLTHEWYTDVENGKSVLLSLKFFRRILSNDTMISVISVPPILIITLYMEYYKLPSCPHIKLPRLNRPSNGILVLL